ncbi:MAG TPA: hypothetical protein VMV12_08705 [Candidatus Micrarchaeaceae archaeon]|nr:hypothetical protein [Candidatus Micrarchaeaceae archaeon]
MTLIRTVKLPGSAAQAWDLLATRQGALRLAPGLTLGTDGRGTLRVLVGGHSVTYRGYARQHTEEEGRHLTWTLSGKEVRGTGRAHAEVRARFRDDPGGGCDLRLTVLVDGRGRLGEIAKGDLDRAVMSVIARFQRAVAKELAGAAQIAASAPPATRPATKTGPERPGPDSVKPPPRAVARVEVMPPSAQARRWVVPGGAALVGALALGVAALVFWRSRRNS